MIAAASVDQPWRRRTRLRAAGGSPVAMRSSEDQVLPAFAEAVRTSRKLAPPYSSVWQPRRVRVGVGSLPQGLRKVTSGLFSAGQSPMMRAM